MCGPAPRSGDPGDLGLDACELVLALGAVFLGFSRVVADDEATRLLCAKADLFHLQVVAHDPVATGAAQRLFRIGRAVAHLLPADVVPTATREIGEVVVGGEPAVDHGDHAPQAPVAQVVTHALQDRLVRGVPWEAPDRARGCPLW